MKPLTETKRNPIAMKKFLRILFISNIILLLPAAAFSQATVDFTADQTTVCQGASVEFTDATTGITGTPTYSWDFGAGATPSTITGSGPHDVVYSSSGLKTVTLTVTDDNGPAFQTKTDYINVNALPVVTFGALADVCVDAAAFALSGGSPVGGTYSGTGVSAGNFSPATAGTGTHTITYTYTDGNGCINSATSDITVNAQPVVTFGALADVCVDAADFALAGGSPVGGTYSGTGVAAGNFSPATAGTGTHTITYTYTDGNG